MNDTIERLAALEHEQWVKWSKDIASKEKLSPERLERWKALWIPYNELSEEMREHDRKWARRVLIIISEIRATMLSLFPEYKETLERPINTDTLTELIREVEADGL